MGVLSCKDHGPSVQLPHFEPKKNALCSGAVNGQAIMLANPT